MARDEHHRDARRDHRREARRAQLLDDAIAAIRELGQTATMEQLARRGGVTKPILYRHFGDRSGLIAAIAVRYTDQLFASVAEALAAGAEDPRTRISHTIDAYLRFIEADPEVYRFLERQAGAAGVHQDTTVATNVARQVALVMGEELRAADLDSGPAVPWAFGIVGMVRYAGDWWLEDGTMTRERLVGYLTDLVWSGAQSAARTSTP
jgi:AcrR family transcriptional regulator